MPISFDEDQPKVVTRTPDAMPGLSVRFPAAWSWFFDETIPNWVKQNYSPKDSWKNKAFSKEDARFFFKGVDELSELFTEERPKGFPEYFSHPKFRSAYLLYFLPLQAAKFVTAFQLHPKALDAAIEHGRKKGVMHVLDLGAGPGTASFALVLQLLQMVTHSGEELPEISFHWVDTNLSSMQDGKKLIEQLGNQFSRLRGKIKVELIREQWWKGAAALREPTSLILMGHLLNESSGPKLPKDMPTSEEPSFDENLDEEDDFEAPPENHQWARPWKEIFSKAEGGGTLIIEPAAKKNSQFLSHLRNILLNFEIIEKDATSIWGPCAHAERCPLSDGRDWCHFSVPAVVPGNWFGEFSKALSSEKQWLKFSYLWFAAQNEDGERAPKLPPNQRLVVSDTLTDPRTGDRSVLICEPDRPGRIPARGISKLKRGDWIKI
jgi:hypothetical protein